MHRLSQIYLAVSALAFLLIGLHTFHDPVTAMAGLDMQPHSVNAFNEIRANYGGMHLGISLLLALGLLSKAWRKPSMWINVVFTSGLVLGRLVSISADGWPNDLVRMLLGIEAAAALTGLALLCFLNKHDARSSMR